jgi:hypothetical protein
MANIQVKDLVDRNIIKINSLVCLEVSGQKLTEKELDLRGGLKASQVDAIPYTKGKEQLH